MATVCGFQVGRAGNRMRTRLPAPMQTREPAAYDRCGTERNPQPAEDESAAVLQASRRLRCKREAREAGLGQDDAVESTRNQFLKHPIGGCAGECAVAEEQLCETSHTPTALNSWPSAGRSPTSARSRRRPRSRDPAANGG